MDIVARAQALILKPKDEWVKIKGETTPAMTLITQYAAILALIPAVAQFIGYGLIGQRIPYAGWVHMSIGSSLVRAIVWYVLGLASVYAFGFVINALAGSFGSKPNLDNAVKLAVYSMTPIWLGGVFYLFLPLMPLAWLAGIYGIYLLYLGFATPLMETPKDKVLPYLVVSAVVYVVIFWIIGLIVGAIFVFGAASVRPF